MRTLLDIGYEPNRLLVAFVVCGLAAGVLTYRAPARRINAYTLAAPLALLAGLAYEAIYAYGQSGDDAGHMLLVGCLSSLAWIVGRELRAVPAPALVVPAFAVLALLGPGFLWSRDATPSVTASGAARTLERAYPGRAYSCTRVVDDSHSLTLSDVQFRCDSRSRRIWLSFDGRGRIRGEQPAAP